MYIIQYKLNPHRRLSGAWRPLHQREGVARSGRAICVYMYICIYTLNMYAHASDWLGCNVYLSVYPYIYVYIEICMYIYVYVCVCMYVCVCVSV